MRSFKIISIFLEPRATFLIQGTHILVEYYKKNVIKKIIRIYVDTGSPRKHEIIYLLHICALINKLALGYSIKHSFHKGIVQ